MRVGSLYGGSQLTSVASSGGRIYINRRLSTFSKLKLQVHIKTQFLAFCYSYPLKLIRNWLMGRHLQLANCAYDTYLPLRLNISFECLTAIKLSTHKDPNYDNII